MRVGSAGASMTELAAVTAATVSPPPLERSPARARLEAAAAPPASAPEAHVARLASNVLRPCDLDALVKRLTHSSSEDVDAKALEALDAYGRAQMAPRLTKVREMARAVGELFALRRDAMAMMRGTARG